jgi:Amino acid:DNA transferase
MNIFEFGDALIQTGDLLHGAQLPRDQLERLLLAYLCFYNLGFAAWVSEKEGEDYWRWMETAAINTEPSPLGGRWPRASERRHFRGEKCVKAIRHLARKQPEYWVLSLTECRSEASVIERVSSWPMFGKWAGFKMADLAERVYGLPLKFDPNIGLLYDAPRATLDALAQSEGRTAQAVYRDLLDHFAKHRAPPGFDRACGPMEAETCCCKFGSFQAGHYFVGHDIHEVRLALKGWGETASRLQEAMPEQPSPPVATVMIDGIGTMAKSIGSTRL